MHVQICCFANINLLLFRRSRFRRRQSPIANWTIFLESSWCEELY